MMAAPRKTPVKTTPKVEETPTKPETPVEEPKVKEAPALIEVIFIDSGLMVNGTLYSKDYEANLPNKYFESEDQQLKNYGKVYYKKK